MRLRVMELPSEYAGEVSSTPFILILDRCNEADVEAWDSTMIDSAKESTGAKAVFVFASEVDLD